MRPSSVLALALPAAVLARGRASPEKTDSQHPVVTEEDPYAYPPPAWYANDAIQPEEMEPLCRFMTHQGAAALEELDACGRCMYHCSDQSFYPKIGKNLSAATCFWIVFDSMRTPVNQCVKDGGEELGCVDDVLTEFCGGTEPFENWKELMEKHRVELSWRW